MAIKQHYVEKGEGFPLILLHGNGENNKYFVHQIKHFSKSYRVIALDTRGHGKSARGKASFTLTQFAEDLKRFLDEQDIKKAIILGFSDGGNIALLFALKYQEYIEALIIDGANLYPSGLKIHVQLSIRAGLSAASAIAPRSKHFQKRKEMLRLMTNEPNIKPAELGTIKVPTLVMAGSRDIIKRSHTEEIFKNLPKAKLAIIDGDHFIAIKKFKQFNEIVDKFLKLTRRKRHWLT